MGDLKTHWTDPVLPTHEPSGQGIVSSGSDPNADGGGGEGALQSPWPADKYAMPTLTSGAESPNSVSGLPALPNRFEPSGTPPAPPDLTDRRPGTIDES
jgi:hypothetical protein